jgi:predicted transcriptional regulator
MQENQMSEKILQEFNSLHMAYHRASSVLVTSLRNALNDIIEYPIRARYSTLSEDAIIKFGEVLYSSISTMEQLSSDLRQTIQNFENNRKEFLNIVSNSVYDATYGKVKNIDISPYTNYMSSMEIPEELTNAIDTVKSTSVSTLKSLWQRPEVDVVRGGLNSVYQQGAWAYKYWDVENNMQKNMEHMMDLLVEIIQDELKELAEATKSIQSPITVWDPEQGEIQAQIKLPFDWEKLYESPDLGPLTTAVDKAVERVEKIYKIVFPNDAAEEEEELQQEEMEKEIEAFKPMSNKLRRIDTVNRSSMRRMGTRTMGTRTMGTRTSGSKYSFSRTRTSGSRYSGSRSSGSRSSGSRSSGSSSFSCQVPTRTRTVSRRRITRS